MTQRRNFRRALLLGSAAALVLSGCSSLATPGDGGVVGSVGSTATPTATPTPNAPVLTITPADSAADVLTTAPVTVSVADGTLGTVTLKDADGKAVVGAVSGSTWTSARPLRPDTAYTVSATATGGDGASTTATSAFRTHKPKITATYHILYDQMTVGVGAPVSIQFDSQVDTKERRAAVEKAVKVTVTPQQEGSWGWLDNRQLMWRPKSYWKPNTKVTVDAPIAGLQTGQDKFVGKDATATMTIGSAMVSSVNIATHMMTVRRNGEVLRTIPVSTGRPGPKTETRSGVKVIIEKLPKVTMDSETIGIKKGEPGYYKIDTEWDLRVTWTGEFLHSAPWSVGAQGNTNVSHGCTNLSPSNAQWMYDHSKIGDVVEYTGSNRWFQPYEGIGVWVYSFNQWKQQSALA